jgi:hypothetical protein
MRSTWAFDVSEKTNIIVGGTVSAKHASHGTSIGASATIRHMYSSMLWGEMSATFGAIPLLSAKVVNNFSSNRYVFSRF